ncbi:MAG: hypothetical protein IJX81_01715 [Clostridia bacterium]|nr:hypothetical protein [Clostridia bacterium]
MKTVFLFFKKAALFGCVLVVAFACILSARVSLSETRTFVRSFHFLVIETEHVEAAAGTSSLLGGAGHVMSTGEGVALGVYFALSSAEAAAANAKKEYPEVKVVSQGIRKFLFSGKRERGNADKIIAAFSTLYEYLHLIYDESVRLERGGTQESSRRLLSGIAKQLAFLGEENGEVEQTLAKTCRAASGELSELIEGTIYAKDLRGFLCVYAENYLSAARTYSF